MARHRSVNPTPPVATVRAYQILLCILLGVQAVAASTPEPWQELEREVDTTGFGAGFVDSLMAAHALHSQKGLRQAPQRLAFRDEKMVLEARWGPFRAGYGIMSACVDSGTAIARVSVAAVTNRLIGALFRVRDFVRSTMDWQGGYPLFFEEHIEEGRYRAKRWALYDHRNGVVFGSRRNYQRVEAEAFTHDFLSVFCALRTMPLEPGTVVSLPCYIQGKVYTVRVTCSGRETLKTDFGERKCLVVEPVVAVEGRNFSKRDRIQLWLTDDARRVLLRVRSKITFGSINAELIHYEVDGEVWDAGT